MLSSFTIEDFKSYRDATLKLAPLTVLIGANASGKSNAIEALRLLSWIAEGNRLGSFRYTARDRERAIRGSVRELCFRGQHAFTLSCGMTGQDWNRYAITLDVRDDDELHISDERVTGRESKVTLFETQRVSGDDTEVMIVGYNDFDLGLGNENRHILCNDHMTLLWQLTSPAAFHHNAPEAATEIPKACRSLSKQLSSITFVDPRPSLMRSYSFKIEQSLTEGGANLSGVLYNLCLRPKLKNEILDLIRALTEQDIQQIEFIETPRGEVMVTLAETFGKNTRMYDVTLLSDGTLRVLAIAAAILSAPLGLVVIEGIDNGVHPSRAAQLLSHVSRIAKQRDLRLLISSHNPALLDALPDDAVPHVVFCYRDPEDSSSRLIRLEDVPDYPELVAQGAVGHLMTHGIIERFVKDYPGPDGRKQQARTWLSALRDGVR